MSLQPIAELTGLSISAPDGVIGSLDDLLFDDTSWRVRYLVIRSGSWLDERMVLIAPHAFVSADLAARTLHVSLSREQIQQSPGLETDPPVYRQHEVTADAMIPPWAIYGGMYAPVIFPYAMIGSRATEKNATDAPSHDSHDPHLRSAREVIGYRIAD
ncbi:MAG: PRC-barrel domain-containing protein, partial [Roseiflexaceae bacterium]